MDNNFLEKYNRDGMVVVNNAISDATVKELKNELKEAIQKECEYHGSEDFRDFGMVLLCAKYGGNFLKIFENDSIFQPFETVLGKDCIMYSNTSSSMPPNKTNFSRRIHIDAPIEYPNEYPLRMLSLILLDDFTNDNGATWFLPKSHVLEEQPSEEEFYSKAKRLNAKAGSILYWNPRIWHAGGNNITNKWRDAFTIVMTRPFCKQRLDIPALLGDINLKDNAMKRLGYGNIPPKSYGEYYGRK